MDTLTSQPAPPLSPLEAFVRDYVEVSGGVWDEIEPQVYDLLLPQGTAVGEPAGKGEVALQVAFDPEAIPEYPGAQLASFGTPLVDHLLAEAVRRGRSALLYLVGLNLTPHDLSGRIRRAFTLPAKVSLRPDSVRALHFGQAVYWFQATFVSDQKEQDIVPVAMDLHYGRRTRHLEQLLDAARLAEKPSSPLAEVRRLSLAAAYPLARAEVTGTVAALANTRDREQRVYVEQQIGRVRQYYADLRNELDEQVRRAASRKEDVGRFAERRQALEREEHLRVAELRQKSTLRVELRLLNLLLVQQPKLLARCAVLSDEHEIGTLEVVWDPLMEATEAVPCPECGRPTFAFAQSWRGQLVCSVCAAAPVPKKPRARSG